VLTAEDEKMEMSKIKDDKNLVEIKNGYFGWQPQTDPARSGGGIIMLYNIVLLCYII